MKNLCLTFLLTCLTFGVLLSQEKNYKVACVAFYNVENLFDTEDDPKIKDEEYTPSGSRAWTNEIYQEKLGNMAYVISKLGKDKTPSGASVIGLSEVENKRVLDDLVAHEYLKDMNYEILHHDSPDFRGIDVAFIYRKDHFEVVDSSTFVLPIFNDDGTQKYTRDILLMSGKLDGELMHFIVNHWPSRRGGEKRSSPLREEGGKICKMIVDSIMTVDPKSKVFVMGDLNDNPDDKSVTKSLGAKGKQKKLKDTDIFNPYISMFKNGMGSNAYRDTWSLFDQIMFTAPVLNKEQDGYFYFQAKIFNKKFLQQKKGQYRGYPKRTYSWGKYVGGYSDHFPVYVYLLKEI